MDTNRNGQAYAAIYARVSTEDQGKGFSIPTQIEACQKLAERTVISFQRHLSWSMRAYRARLWTVSPSGSSGSW